MSAPRLSFSQLRRGPLVLVNREHSLPGTAAPELQRVWDGAPDVLLERRAAELLRRCVCAAGGWGKIVPVSGWRSRAEQQRIWDDTLEKEGEAFARQFVALPGCSEHETGLAIDLGQGGGAVDFIRPAFPETGACGAFRRLAARYGFVLRYPEGKERVTGIAHEPWHFRYVGVPHARLMEEAGLCLEEYFDFLRERPRRCVLENGLSVTARYVPWDGTARELELPEGCWQLSGDNASGFVLTVWEMVA